MTRIARTALLCLAAIAAAALSPHGAAAKPYNQSSHPPEFFRDLLSGRVFVFNRFNRVSAVYFAANGSLYSCRYSIHGNRYLSSFPTSTWRIGTPAGPSNLEVSWTDTEEIAHDDQAPIPYRHARRRVIIYDPDTGSFHTESYFSRSDHWRVARRGWIQTAWPQALVSRCSDLDLPASLRIDARQNTADFSRTKATATPIRNPPGSNAKYPGATGIGAAGNRPTLTPEHFHAAIRGFHGYIARTPRGRRAVFNILPDRRETWLLNDDDGIRDTGTVTLTDNGRLLTTTWNFLGIKRSIHVGYPISAISTGVLHPAFAMMKDIAAAKTPVAVSLDGNQPIPHVFGSHGAVTAERRSGTWHISRGAIHVAIAGRSRTFPWREFAEIAGWEK